MFYIVKGLWNKLPIYQEVEKVSGNALSKISAIPVYLGQVLMVKCGSWTPEIEGSTPST